MCGMNISGLLWHYSHPWRTIIHRKKDQIMSMSKCEAAPACHWIYCVEETCAKNKTYAHTCQCNPGYSNLLNIPVFLCYSDCATGPDSWRRLGIRVAKSTSNGSNSSSNDSNKGIGSSNERSSC